MAIVGLAYGGKKALDRSEVHEWSLLVIHCNMKAYSTSFAIQLKLKTGKTDDDCPSPLILIRPFNGGSAWREFLGGLTMGRTMDSY